MSMLERLSDARGTIEGKVVAIALALLLVMPVVSVTAFAEPEEHHGSQGSVKMEEYTPGEGPVPIEKTAEASVPSVQAEEPQEPAEEPVDSIEIEGRFNYDIVANGTDKYYGYPVVFLQNRKDQQFEIPFELRASNPNNKVPTVEGKYFQGWACDKSSSTADFAGAFYTIPGDYVVNEKDHAFELYPVYSTVPLQYVTVESAGYEGPYDGEAHGITVTVTQYPVGAQPSVYYHLEGSDSDWSEEPPTLTNATSGPVTVEFEVKCAGCEPVWGSQDVTIYPARLSVETNSAKKTYDGTPLAAEGISVTGFVNGETAPYAATGKQEEVGEAANTYEIDWDADVATAKEGNYTVTQEKLGTLKVTPAPVTITVNDASKKFGDKDPAFRGTIEGEVAGHPLQGVTYFRTNDAEGVGAYANVLSATFDDNPNYAVTIEPGTFTINAADAADISATPVTKTFDGQLASIKVSIEASAEDGWTLQYSTDDGDDKTWSTENPSFVDAGTYKVYVKATCPGHADAGWVSATVTINPKQVTITVNDASKTVGAADPEITGTIEGEVAGHPLKNVRYQRRTNAQAVGTYVDDLTVVFDADPNYDVTVIEGDFTINPLPAPGTVPGDGGPIDAIVNFLTTPILGGTPAVDGPMASIADDGTPMASIDDEGTPLGAFDHPMCWIHYYILLGIIITAIYGGGVIARRLNHSRKVKGYEDDARGASRSKDRAASPAAAKAQPVMVERADA